MGKDLRPVYTAATEQAAKECFGEFADTLSDRYPASEVISVSFMSCCVRAG